MGERIVETKKLENGLLLEMWETSRPLAGDRWLVSLEARIDIPLEGDLLNASLQGVKNGDILREIFGPAVPYRYCRKKHFVDGKEKEKVFTGFLDTFKRDVVPYLAHPDFSKKVVLSKERELRSKRPELFSREAPNT